MINDLRIRTDLNFDAKLIWGWLIGTYSDDFIATIHRIYKEVNWNESKLTSISFIESFPVEMFYNVLNAYGNILVANKNLPEYDGNKPDSYNSPIVKETATKSGVNEDFTNRVLKQLYWSTEQGRILYSKWIRPRSFMESQGYRELREDAKGSNWLQKVMWILIIMGASIATFYLFRAYSVFKTTKKLTSSPSRKQLTK